MTQTMVSTMVCSHKEPLDSGGCHVQISASQFKASCLGLMDEVARNGELKLITKNGTPVAELHPCRSERRPTPFDLHPTTLLLGDLITPQTAHSWLPISLLSAR